MKIRIEVKGFEQARHWARVFELGDEVEHVRSKLEPGSEQKGEFASMPVVGEHHVDPGLIYYFIIVFHVDQLGIHDGHGLVYICDKANEPDIAKHRDQVADKVLAEIRQHTRVDELHIRPASREQ